MHFKYVYKNYYYFKNTVGILNILQTCLFAFETKYIFKKNSFTHENKNYTYL